MAPDRSERTPPREATSKSGVGPRRSRALARGGRGWIGKRFSILGQLGPGLVTGASDDDPSGIATYSQAGATFGLGLLWTSLLTLPLMAGVQEICDRTALATGETLGELCRRRFAVWGRVVVASLLVLLLAANALNVAADLVAIGAGVHLLHGGPVTLWAAIAGIAITLLLVTGSFTLIANVFKVLCLALLAYVGVLFLSNPNWFQVASNTLVPHITLSSSYLVLFVAVLGTTISPYLFFWQNMHRVEDLREEAPGGDEPLPLSKWPRRAGEAKERSSRFDVFAGMTLSNVVMFSIVVASASTLGRHGHPQIHSASQAAAALKPIAGSAASLLFALGFIGSGMLAVPVLAGSAAAGAAGLLGKTSGFSQSIRKAPWFYGLVALSTLGATALSLADVNAIHLLVLCAELNGIVAAPLLAVVMLVADDKHIMKNYRNGPLARIIGWGTTLLMGAAAILLIATGGISLP